MLNYYPAGVMGDNEVYTLDTFANDAYGTVWASAPAGMIQTAGWTIHEPLVMPESQVWTVKYQTYWNDIVSMGDPVILYQQGIIYFYDGTEFQALLPGGGGSGHTHANKAVLDQITQAMVNSVHTHANKTVLDGIAAEDITAWDGAVANEHTHSNKSILDSIDSSKINQ